MMQSGPRRIFDESPPPACCYPGSRASSGDENPGTIDPKVDPGCRGFNSRRKRLEDYFAVPRRRRRAAMPINPLPMTIMTIVPGSGRLVLVKLPPFSSVRDPFGLAAK